MGILQPPIVPSRLHRYRSLSRSARAIDEEIDSIVKNYIYCADFSRMNDPMEGFYRPSKLLKGSDDYKAIVGDITGRKSAIGIACFSETDENVLMWTHYAGNYAGICISYSGSELLRGSANSVNLVRLAYVDDPPMLFPSHAQNADNAAVRILSQKKYKWAYEREWRILASVGKVSLGRAKAIKQISLGSRIDPSHRKKLLDAIRGTGIEAYSMEIDGYEHTWEAIVLGPPARRKKVKRKARKP
jgi:hypothetical protein